MIDDHEHVIDCIKFAPEAACRTIQTADYNKLALKDDPGENMNDSTGDNTRGEDPDMVEEQKRMDGESSHINESIRMSTKDKVAKLKQDLMKRKAIMKGELTEDALQPTTDPNESVQIDTTI
jgi:hypothetical protein